MKKPTYGLDYFQMFCGFFVFIINGVDVFDATHSLLARITSFCVTMLGLYLAHLAHYTIMQKKKVHQLNELRAVFMERLSVLVDEMDKQTASMKDSMKEAPQNEPKGGNHA